MSKDKRFTIEDAFSEEIEDSIKIYGSTTHPITKNSASPKDIKIRIEQNTNNQRNQKYNTDETADTASRDSDSLIQEYDTEPNYKFCCCWNHPKVRENWRVFLAALVLLIVGIALLGMSAYSVAYPTNGSQAAVFFIAGLICVIPGGYHVAYIWLASIGFRGFDFYHLPLFT